MNFIVKTTFFLLLITFSISCQNCAGCGDCIYEGFEEEVIVKEINYNSDSTYVIDFSVLNNEKQIIKLDSYELIRLIQDESILESILNKNSILLFKGARIAKGTCTPFSIEEVSLSSN